MNVTQKRVELVQAQLEMAENLLRVARTDLTTNCNASQFNRIAKQLRRAVASATASLNRVDAFAESTATTATNGTGARTTNRNRQTTGSCQR